MFLRESEAYEALFRLFPQYCTVSLIISNQLR
jgi:hypothetical protein